MELSNCKQLEVLHAGVNAIKELAPGLFSRGGGDAPVAEVIDSALFAA